LARADDAKPATPPGYKTVYVNAGGKKVPILVKQQYDSLRNVHNPDDPRDPRRIFSSTNSMADKAFVSGLDKNWDKSAKMKDAYATKPYAFDATPTSNASTRHAFGVTAYPGVNGATGFDKNFATTTADAGQDKSADAFAAIGASEQNRTAPIEAKPVETFAAPMASQKFIGPEEETRHKRLTRLDNGQLLVQDLPDRPLTIDEVRDLINHGFKPDTSAPPSPASKPLNDPNYQPEPLRIEPTEPETPAPPPKNAKDDDNDDPVPSPGTMAEPLPK
jgi:hypothetical protein